MSKITETLNSLNENNKKALSIFLTAGFPAVDGFIDLVCDVYDAGADMIELGIPFSDPLADGPVIQHSSEIALKNGITLQKSLQFVKEIKSRVDKPLILMGYANPIMRFGITNFTKQARGAGVDGLIIPDVPLEEYDNFFNEYFDDFDIILLTTPTSSEERIKKLDTLSRGFLYCVSVTGTTGVRNNFTTNVKDNLARTYKLIEKNKMLIGFGISSPDNIKTFYDVGDGFIVGSVVVKSLLNKGKDETLELVKSLAGACH